MQSRRSLQSRKFPILLYHGVTDAASEGIENYSRKHISLEDFEAQISYVAKKLNSISLREMAEALAAGRELPAGTVAISFDDTLPAHLIP